MANIIIITQSTVFVVPKKPIKCVNYVNSLQINNLELHAIEAKVSSTFQHMRCVQSCCEFWPGGQYVHCYYACVKVFMLGNISSFYLF